jgi:hypothetical protein
VRDKVTCIAFRGKVTCLRVPEILPSARRCGVSDQDMLHALRNPVRVIDMDDGLTMFIGPAATGALLEVGVVDGHSGR